MGGRVISLHYTTTIDGLSPACLTRAIFSYRSQLCFTFHRSCITLFIFVDIFSHFVQPYLHESRHLHAMRRARGSGGRFLNTKKPNNVISNTNREEDINSGANHLTKPVSEAGSKYMVTDKNGIKDTLDEEGREFMTQNMQITHAFFNGKSNVHGLSTYNSQLADVEGGHLNQPHESMQVNGAPQRAIPIN